MISGVACLSSAPIIIIADSSGLAAANLAQLKPVEGTAFRHVGPAAR